METERGRRRREEDEDRHENIIEVYKDKIKENYKITTLVLSSTNNHFGIINLKTFKIKLPLIMTLYVLNSAITCLNTLLSVLIINVQ